MKLMTNLKNILFTACAALLTQGCHMTADRGISTDGARAFLRRPGRSTAGSIR